MSNSADDSTDSKKTQAIEEDMDSQQKENRKGDSPSAKNESINLLTDSNQSNSSEVGTSPTKKDEDTNAISSSDQEHVQSQYYKRLLSIIVLQIILVVLLMTVSVGYGWFHGVPHAFSGISGGDGIEAYREAIANYDFVGVSPDNPEPSFFSVMIEAGLWSLAGVLARSAYNLTRLSIRRKDVRLLETISQLIGNVAMGVAIAMAAVAFLRSTELVNLTLKTADIGAIAAVSFILGFYHEDTRRLLGSIQSRVSGTGDEIEEDKKTV